MNVTSCDARHSASPCSASASSSATALAVVPAPVACTRARLRGGRDAGRRRFRDRRCRPRRRDRCRARRRPCRRHGVHRLAGTRRRAGLDDAADRSAAGAPRARCDRSAAYGAVPRQRAPTPPAQSTTPLETLPTLSAAAAVPDNGQPPPPRPPADKAARRSVPRRAGDLSAPTSVLLVDEQRGGAALSSQRQLQALGLRTEIGTRAANVRSTLLAQQTSTTSSSSMSIWARIATLDGLALCQHLKRQHAPAGGRRAPRVVMVSAHASATDRVRGSFAGCDAYLVKPLDDDALRRSVAPARRPAADARRRQLRQQPAWQLHEPTCKRSIRSARRRRPRDAAQSRHGVARQRRRAAPRPRSARRRAPARGSACRRPAPPPRRWRTPPRSA